MRDSSITLIHVSVCCRLHQRYILRSEYHSREVRQLRPVDVLKVQYMESPTGKYAGNNVALNFILKKRNSGDYIAQDDTQRIGYTNGDYNLAWKAYVGTTFTPADRASAYVKLSWSFDFGKKTSRDNLSIDRTISTGVIRAE